LSDPMREEFLDAELERAELGLSEAQKVEALSNANADCTRRLEDLRSKLELCNIERERQYNVIMSYREQLNVAINAFEDIVEANLSREEIVKLAHAVLVAIGVFDEEAEKK
jgi:hypothetical protein